MQTLTIGPADWVRGVSTSDKHNDGGFSPLMKGHNLELYQGGLLLPQPARSDLSSGVNSSIIAFTADPSFLGNDGYALDDTGRFYTINGSTVTVRQTDTTRTFVSGTSYLKTYKGSLYVTSTTNIGKLDASNITTYDPTWWTVTIGSSALQSTYRHPLEVIEDTLYIGDQNYIHTWNGVAGVYQAMSLPNSYNITNMIAHTDGRHLLVFMAETVNYSHTRRARAKLFVVDTVNLEFEREIDIDAQVEGSINVGGVIYVTSGENLGYFNGDGITFLRKLGTNPTYSHNMANKDGVLLVREGNAVLAYGNLGGKGNVFWYPYQTTHASTLSAIYYYGSGKILTSSAGQKLDLVDFAGFGGAAEWDSNFYAFPGKVWIRKVRIETEYLTSGSSMLINIVDKSQNVKTVMALSYASDGAINEKEAFCNILLDLAKFRVSFDAGNAKGVRNAIIYYEDAE
jgi:hypothetical protein